VNAAASAAELEYPQKKQDIGTGSKQQQELQELQELQGMGMAQICACIAQRERADGQSSIEGSTSSSWQHHHCHQHQQKH